MAKNKEGETYGPFLKDMACAAGNRYCVAQATEKTATSCVKRSANP